MAKRSLVDRLAEARNIVRDEYSEFHQAYQRLLAMLHERQIGRSALGIGERLPEFALFNAEGKLVSSPELLSRGPLVLSFYRGEWCRFCGCELDALSDFSEEIREAGGHIAMVSGETGGQIQLSKRKHRADYEILNDVDLGIAMRFGLIFQLPADIRALYARKSIDLGAIYGNVSGFLPIPATYIVGTDARVVDAHVDPDFTRRMDPAEIIATLERMQAGTNAND